MSDTATCRAPPESDETFAGGLVHTRTLPTTDAATLLRLQVYEPIVEGRVCGADVAGIGCAAVANGDKKCAAPAQAVGSARRALAAGVRAAPGVLSAELLESVGGGGGGGGAPQPLLAVRFATAATRLPIAIRK